MRRPGAATIASPSLVDLMIRLITPPLLAIACGGATLSCGVRARPALPIASAGALGLSAAALERIAPALQSFVDSDRVSGIYAVIARHGRIGYERTFGKRDVARRAPLRRAAIYRIYSMTKPVVAVGILRLMEEGKLDLDDPVSRCIPSFANVQVFAGGSADAPVLEEPTSPITVRQLLNHTSGLAYGLTPGPVDTIFRRAQLYDARRTLAEFTDSLAAIPLLFQPGTQWSYSSGFDVARTSTSPSAGAGVSTARRTGSPPNLSNTMARMHPLESNGRSRGPGAAPRMMPAAWPPLQSSAATTSASRRRTTPGCHRYTAR